MPLDAHPLRAEAVVNWNAVGAIAELIGAIGVVGSLVYLATQIRSNTRAVKVAAYQQNSTAYRELNLAIIGDPDLVVRLSPFTQEGLLDAKLDRVSDILLNYFQSLHYQYEQGFLDDDLWSSHQESVRQIVSSAEFQARWRSKDRGGLRPSFRSLVQHLMGQPDRSQFGAAQQATVAEDSD